jgi:hypothetical protein
MAVSEVAAGGAWGVGAVRTGAASGGWGVGALGVDKAAPAATVTGGDGAVASDGSESSFAGVLGKADGAASVDDATVASDPILAFAVPGV